MLEVFVLGAGFSGHVIHGAGGTVDSTLQLGGEVGNSLVL
jgi:hypothetical protein